MPRASKRVATLAVLAIAAGGLAACSSTSSNTGSSTAPTAATSSEKPQSGGTLNIVAASGPDHIDTVPAYYTPDYELERVYTRQLVSYPTVPAASTSSAAWTTDTTPVADAATEVPTTANGGISDNGTVYTFHIKQGVDWDTTPARQVTSQDFLREFKAFFNPISPVGNPVYYTSTIKGMQTYDTEETAYFADTAHKPTAANIANFQNTHSIAGISTPNSTTIQFTLMAPASDFIYMLGPPGRVRLLRAELDPAGRAHDLRRAVPDQLVRRRQVDHVRPQPGLEAVDRHHPARLPDLDRGDPRRRLGPDPAGRHSGGLAGPDQ
jgi:peptide/nickel transport system substrate-binding protein